MPTPEADEVPKPPVDDLKGCPFCGNIGRVQRRNFSDRFHSGEHDWLVVCPGNGCCSRNGKTETEAIAAWNRRAELSRSPEAPTEIARSFARECVQAGYDHRWDFSADANKTEAVVSAELDELAGEMIAAELAPSSRPLGEAEPATWEQTPERQRLQDIALRLNDTTLNDERVSVNQVREIERFLSSRRAPQDDAGAADKKRDAELLDRTYHLRRVGSSGLDITGRALLANFAQHEDSAAPTTGEG